MKKSSQLEIAVTLKNYVEECLKKGASDPGVFRCTQFENRNVYVGCNSNRELVALFPPLVAPSRTSVNSVSFDAQKDVKWETNLSDSAKMSILTLSGDMSEDIDVFTNVVATVILGTSPEDSGQSYGSIIEAWFDMLSRSQESTNAEILGLWGELFVIYSSSDLGQAVDSWQWKDTENIDFQYRGTGMEVKTSSHLRRHRTSLPQYLKAIEISAIYASIYSFNDPHGLSVLDLMDLIFSNLGTDDQNHRHKIVSAINRRVGLGHKVRSTKFNLTSSEESLRFFTLSEIPKPTFPPEIVSAEWTFELRSGGVSLDELSQSTSLLSKWLNN